MHDIFDEQIEGAEWDDELEETEPTVVDLNLDEINRMLGALDRLHRRVAEYARLERQELDRLKARRETVLGYNDVRGRRGMIGRIAWLEDTVKQFALKAWRDEQRGRFALPNGTVKSTAVQDIIEADAKNDEFITWVIDYLTRTPDPEPVLEFPPKLMVGSLRKRLAELETAGAVQRFIAPIVPDDDNPTDQTVIMLEPGERIYEPLHPGDYGGWMIVDTGDVIPGLTWSPNGDDGVGRNFSIVL